MFHLLVHVSSNRRGIRMGVAGAVIGLIAGLISNSVVCALLATGVWWIASAIPRFNDNLPARPFPWLLFLPLQVWGLIVMLLVIPARLAEKEQARTAADPRLQELNADLRAMTQKLSGDDDISRAVAEALKPYTNLENTDGTHIFSRRRDDKILVLLRLSSLSEMPDHTREDLLDRICGALPPGNSGVFIGVQGEFFFGAVQTPPNVRLMGRIVADRPLLSFYGPEPVRPVIIDHQ